MAGFEVTMYGRFWPTREEFEAEKKVTVLKSQSGSYQFFAGKLDLTKRSMAHRRRREAVSQQLSRAFRDGRQFLLGTPEDRREYTIKFTANEVEDLLFLQFPKIFLFNESYSLVQNLPERITLASIEQDTGSFQDLFIDYLDRKKVSEFLFTDKPATQQKLIDILQKKADELTERVNSQSGTGEQLFGIILHENNGLQITVETDRKNSFYSQISDNTKFLFAYFLYQSIYGLEHSILLFDEPNNGFHGTAQKLLLNFLESLSEQNLVIVSTHSEYLIDLDRLSGIRIMSSDENQNIIVKKHIFSQKGKGDFLALQPILDAIGLSYANQINLRDKVIITEGITDLIYIRVFNKVLGYNLDLNIAPARGDSVMINLVPFLLSQGISFKIIIDKGKHKANLQKEYDDLEERFFYEIPAPKQYGNVKWTGIEDLFSKEDFKRIVLTVQAALNDTFYQETNSAYIKKRGKRLVAQALYDKIQDLSEQDFEEETRENFRHLLDFCKDSDWFSL